MEERIRLDRYLGELGVGTRSQIRDAVRKGRVAVNGSVAKNADLKIDWERDTVTLDGGKLSYKKYEYIILNKPQGVVSATEDTRHRTVLDLLTGCVRQDLFPVGRLDIDTEGLLILTNDGAFAHRLLSPKRHVPKTYYLETATPIPHTAPELFAKGFSVDRELDAMPSVLELLGDTQARLTIEEGKFHQVKRMMAAVGCQVTCLKRISMGSLSLDPALAPGEYRQLTKEELAALQNL